MTEDGSVTESECVAVAYVLMLVLRVTWGCW